MENEEKMFLKVNVSQDGNVEIESNLSNMGVLVLINDISRSILLEIDKASNEEQEEGE